MALIVAELPYISLLTCINLSYLFSRELNLQDGVAFGFPRIRALIVDSVILKAFIP